MSRFLLAPLSSTRAILSLKGPDAAKFLQGLVSNDVLSHGSDTLAASTSGTPPHSSPSVYAGLFNAQGRILHDVFVLPSASNGTTDFLIDYPRHVTSPALLSHLKRFILRSKVKAQSEDDAWRIWAVFPDPLQALDSASSSSASEAEEHLHEVSLQNKGRWWKDTRSPQMGYRLLLPPTASPSIESFPFAHATPTHHTLLRTLSNVPEAPSDFVPGQAVPLESNFDVMGGIDFRKGCYVGQELSARTWHTGVIRKRIMPVRLYRPDTLPPASIIPTDLTSVAQVEEIPHLSNIDIKPLAPPADGRPRRAKSAGRISSMLGVRDSDGREAYIGLALMRRESVDGELGLDFETKSREDTSEPESHVNPAGGFLSTTIPDRLKGEWRVKAFQQSLDQAR